MADKPKSNLVSDRQKVKSSVEGIGKLKPTGSNKSNNQGSGKISSNKGRKKSSK